MTAFDDWLRRSWPQGAPSWDPAYLRELFKDDQRRVAQARAASAEGQRIAALERRLAAVERVLGPGGRSLIGGMATAVGEAIGKERERTKRWVAEEFERQAVLRDAGIWTAEREYRAGDLVSHRGGGWVCKVASRGLRPGDSNGGWRLAVKSGEGK